MEAGCEAEEVEGLAGCREIGPCIPLSGILWEAIIPLYASRSTSQLRDSWSTDIDNPIHSSQQPQTPFILGYPSTVFCLPQPKQMTLHLPFNPSQSS